MRTTKELSELLDNELTALIDGSSNPESSKTMVRLANGMMNILGKRIQATNMLRKINRGREVEKSIDDVLVDL